MESGEGIERSLLVLAAAMTNAPVESGEGIESSVMAARTHSTSSPVESGEGIESPERAVAHPIDGRPRGIR